MFPWGTEIAQRGDKYYSPINRDRIIKNDCLLSKRGAKYWERKQFLLANISSLFSFFDLSTTLSLNYIGF